MHGRRQNRFHKLAVTLLACSVLGSVPALAQTFTVIHTFNGAQDGAYPNGGLTIDHAGNFYGTTSGGPGSRDTYGGVFKLIHQGSGWVLNPLYHFQGRSDGKWPRGKPVFGPDGSLYGVTEYGGSTSGDGYGTVYKLQPPLTACHTVLCSWSETVLHRFGDLADGGGPLYVTPIFDAAGNLYGTTIGGGRNSAGLVFSMTLGQGGWTLNALYSFSNGGDGLAPQSGVIGDADGNLYGTVSDNANGQVYELSPSGSGWVKNTLYRFQGGDDGSRPIGGLVADGAGNLYGTTSESYTGGGTVFKLKKQPNGTWLETVLHQFTQRGIGSFAALTLDAAGNLYGTINSGGLYGCGEVFEMVYNDDLFTYQSLHDFSCDSDGAYPAGDVTIDANGNLWGTTSNGGSGHQYEGDGVIWEITP